MNYGNAVGATIGRPLYNYGKIMPLRCHLERSVAESKPEGQTATPFGSRRKIELSLKNNGILYLITARSDRFAVALRVSTTGFALRSR